MALAALPVSRGIAADPIEAIAGLDHGGQAVVIATDGGAIVIRDIASGGEIARKSVPIAHWLAAAIGNDGTGFAGVGVDAAGDVKLVIWSHGAVPAQVIDAPFGLDGHDRSFIETPQIAPDGRFVVFRRDDDEPGYLVNLSSGKVIATVGSTSARPFSPDGARLAHFDEGTGSVSVLSLDTLRTEIVHDPGSKIGLVSYLPDGRLAIVKRLGCEVLHVVNGGGALTKPVSPQRDSCYASDISADGQFLIAVEAMQQAVILNLANGELVWSRPDGEADQIETDAGVVIRDRNDRLHLAPLTGGEERSLAPKRVFLRNSYRSVVLAGGRYLSMPYDEALQVFDLRTLSELACFDAGAKCEATRIRGRYGHALARGEPAEVVAVLTSPGDVRGALGDQWGLSRIELARAQLALGNRTAARGAYAQAMDDPDLQIRVGAQIGLARQLLQEGEPARATALVDDAAATLVAGGAAADATSQVLVRASNGQEVALSPADLTQYKALLGGLGSVPFETLPEGSRIVLGEQDFAKVSDVLALSTRGVRAVGFADGVWITKHRYALFALLGEAQALRALLALQPNGRSRPNERGAAALELLNVGTVLFDGDQSNLNLEMRIERQVLRSAALRNFTDVPGLEILGPLRSALAQLEDRQPANPQSAARLRVALADAQALIGAQRDAEDNLVRAEQDLRRALPEDHPDLLRVTGMAALAESRREETGRGLARIEGAIALARASSQLGAERVAELKPLFGAGVEALWLAGQTEPPARAQVTVTKQSPLFVSLRPKGPIRRLAFASDGQQLTSWEGLRSIDWDLANGQSLSAKKIESGSEVGFFDRDRPIRFADGERTARIGEIADTVLITGKGSDARIEIRFSSVIGAMAVSPDGRAIAVGDAFSSVLMLYDTSTGKAISQLDGHSDPIMSLAWSADSALLASGSKAGAILVHDPQAGFVVKQLGARIGETMHRGEIEDFAFSPDGSTLYTLANATAERDQPPLRQWDTASRRLTARFPTGRDELLVVSADGTRVATLDSTGIDLFDPQNPAQREHGIEAQGPVAASYQKLLTFAAPLDPERLLLSSQFSGGGTRAVTLVDGTVQWSNPTVSGNLIAVDVAGERAALFNSLNEKMFIVSLKDGAEICQAEVPYLYDGDRFAPGLTNGRLAFSRDGASLIGIGRVMTDAGDYAPLAEGIGRVVQWQTGDCALANDKGGAAAQAEQASLAAAWGGDVSAVTVALADPDDPAMEIGFSQDGTLAWAITRRNAVWLWFADPGQVPVQLAQFASPILKAQFSPDGSRLAISSEVGLWLWNARTGALEGELGQ